MLKFYTCASKVVSLALEISLRKKFENRVSIFEKFELKTKVNDMNGDVLIENDLLMWMPQPKMPARECNSTLSSVTRNINELFC